MKTLENHQELFDSIGIETNRFTPASFGNYCNMGKFLDKLSTKQLIIVPLILLKVIQVVITIKGNRDKTFVYLVNWIAIVIEILLYTIFGKKQLCSAKLFIVKNPNGNTSYYFDNSSKSITKSN